MSHLGGFSTAGFGEGAVVANEGWPPAAFLSF
jgi:hypothetical protein